jgi:D-beta-D-heptose 7-phosphate kinase/D-beta-D-heptose 1-phosphate adenosyltransferase
VNPQEARATVLEALEMVDHVVIFEEDTPYELIKAIEPDVLTKGGDYTPETVVGREFAQETVIISFLEGYSTTKTIEKMNNHG